MTQKRRPSLQHISIDLLVRGKYQPRHHFDPDKLQELAESIKTTGGLLQPIIVRPIMGGKYEIVAGERRWRAAQIATIMEVPCLVYEYTDEQTLQASIIENISRDDLNPIEEAKAYQRMIDEFQYLHEEIAASVGKSRTVITNLLRLLKLEPSIQALLNDRKLSEGHGKILAGLLPHEQLELSKKCVDKNWNVRKLEIEAKKIQESPQKNDGRYSDANLKKLEMSLSEHLGNRVSIDCEERGGGYMRIRFNNVDELEGLFDQLEFEKSGH